MHANQRRRSGTRRPSGLAVVLIVLLAACALGLAATVGSAAPSAPVTIRVWDWNAGESYYKTAFDQFNRSQDKIRVDYQFQNGTTFGTAVQAAYESGNPPDVFMGYFETMPNLISKRWIRPIGKVNDPAVSKWMKTFPPGLFKENVHIFGQKGVGRVLYSFPYFQSSTIYLYYNKDVLRRAGLSRAPRTWKELRDYSAQVVRNTDGDAYGLVTGGKDNWPWFMNISYLAATAGACNMGVGGALPSAFDFSSGRYAVADSPTLNAMRLWLQMKSDGSTYPAIDSIGDAEAHVAFGTGKAAFLFSGNWTPSVLKSVAPDADFGVASVPVPAAGRRGYDMLSYGPSWVMSSRTKSPAAAFEVMRLVTSAKFQEGYVKSGAGLSIFPRANRPQFLSQNKGLVDIDRIARQTTRPAISLPLAVNKLAPKFSEPGYTQVIGGIWGGKITPRQGLADLASRMNQALDAALVDLQKQGVKITRKSLTASTKGICLS